MADNSKHSVLVTLPMPHFVCLTRMVAGRILENPTDQTRVATICKEIICEYLDALNEEQTRETNSNSLSINEKEGVGRERSSEELDDLSRIKNWRNGRIHDFAR